MLQQTRVEAVIPYYERFLARFPTVEALAGAAESDVLVVWSGLGYYSRARNLHKAAKRVAAGVHAKGLPASYGELRELPGVGPYTAAAVASIALGLPHAAVDGNVLRVISRLTNDASEVASPAARRRIAAESGRASRSTAAGGFQSGHDGAGGDGVRAGEAGVRGMSGGEVLRGAGGGHGAGTAGEAAGGGDARGGAGTGGAGSGETGNACI